MAAGAQLFVDFVSQPSRACAIVCLAAGLPVTIRPTHIHKRENFSKAYLERYPLHKVPLYVEPLSTSSPASPPSPPLDGRFSRRNEGEFVLPESQAILRYLASRFKGLVGSLYPVHDPRRVAVVDAVVAWQTGAIRMGAAALVFNRVLAKNVGQTPRQSEDLEMKTLLKGLHELETFWLKGGKYTTGEEVTIADIFVVCELEQLRLLLEEGKEILGPYPRTQKYMKDVAEALAPHWEKIHKPLRIFESRLRSAKAKKEASSRL